MQIKIVHRADPASGLLTPPPAQHRQARPTSAYTPPYRVLPHPRLRVYAKADPDLPYAN
uniref:Uncharacterized protein n=1 Tax=Human herpesvirus 2 TaxID=10310 RepID=A0A481TVQ3_HHV2|nr:hypothetical protein [Human alphaherpesvirus 2]